MRKQRWQKKLLMGLAIKRKLMILKILSSNSSGNCYVLQASNGQILLIECGVHISKIKKAIGFMPAKVAGCILTHEHMDHAKSIKQLLSFGVNVWASAGTHTACGSASHHRARVLVSGISQKVGDFEVIGFDVQHDVAEPFGFLVRHHECGTVLFLTDTYYSGYTFKGLDNIIIEANYCQEIIDARVESGDNPKFLRDRVLQSHQSLQTCLKTLAANDLSRVNNIVLIHLSDGNSDEEKFKREVQRATGKIVHVAVPGMVINFSKQPI